MMGEFRKATGADAEIIIAMMRQYYAEDGYPFEEAEAREAVLELIHDPQLGRLWVAMHNGEIAGYLAVTLGYSLEYRGRDAFIDEVFLAESARHLGLGRRAIELAEAYCRTLGVKALHLEVEPHRESARALYISAGFEDHSRHLMTKLL